MQVVDPPSGAGAPDVGWFASGSPGPPDHEIGGASDLIVLVRTDDVAVWLSQFSGYPSGVAFRLSVRLRTYPEGLDADPYASPLLSHHPRRAAPRGVVDPDDLLMVGIELADGRRAMDPAYGSSRLRPRPPGRAPDPDAPLSLSRASGTSSDLRADHTLWLSPAPGDGPVTFLVAWGQVGVPETRVTREMPFGALTGQAVTLWPPQPPRQPVPRPADPGRPTRGWFGEVAGEPGPS